MAVPGSFGSLAAAQGAATPPKAETAANKRIPGYLLTDLLGQTFYTETWRCWNVASGKIFAAKIFKEKVGPRWQALQQGLAAMALRFRHLEADPHVISFLEADLQAEAPYLLTELVDGGSLQSQLASGRKSPRVILPWLEQTAGALAFVHAEGIFHGNLKPGNVLLDLRSRARVADFGQLNIPLAAQSEALGYVAPELARQAAAQQAPQPDLRSDVYSLGACFYALLTGRAPHQDALEALRSGGSAGEDLLWAYAKLPQPLKMRAMRAATRGMADEDLLGILGKCLDPEPKRRYGSMALVLEDLKARREMRPVQPLARQAPYRLKKFVRRNWGMLAALFVALSCLAAAFAVNMRNQRELGKQLVFSYVLRANQYADKKDYPSAAACYAQLNRLSPSSFARANALAYLEDLSISRVIIDNPQGIASADFSPDGKWVLAGNMDNSARLWSLEGLAQAQPMRQGDQVVSVAFSPDGKTLLTGSNDGTARLWDAKSGAPLCPPLKHSNNVLVASFQPGGGAFLTLSMDRKLRIWPVKNPSQPLLTIDTPGDPRSAAFSPDGKTVFSFGATDKTLRLWDASSGKPLAKPMLHGGEIFMAAFSPDGSLIAVACADKVAYVWEAATGKLLLNNIVQGDQIRCLAFSPDGTRLATGSGDKNARLWDLKTGQPLSPPLEHQGWVVDLSFSPDGRSLMSASLDKTVRFWDAQNGEPLGQPLFHPWSVLMARFAPDGRHLLTRSSDGSLRIFDTPKRGGGPKVLSSEGWSACYAVSDDCRFGAAGDYAGALTLWTLASGEKTVIKDAHTAWITSAAYSPAGGVLATASADKTVRFWSPSTGAPLFKPLQLESTVLRVIYSPDGSKLLTYCEGETTRLWDATTGKALGKPIQHPSRITSLAFSPDGTKLLAGNEGSVARLWDLKSGAMLGKPMAHESHVTAVAFSPDGKKMVTGGYDQSARMWSTATCLPYGKVMHEESLLLDARFSPDGRRVLTTGNGGTLRLWDAETGKPVGKEMQQEWGISSLIFSPDSRLIFSCTYIGAVQVWDAERGEPMGKAMLAKGPLDHLYLSPDQRTLYGTSTNVNGLYQWDVSWLSESVDPALLMLRTEVATFKTFDKDGSLLRLSIPEWRERDAKLRTEAP